MKNLYLIRHGYALHNFLYWKIGTDAYDIRDTQLMQKGVEQATNLGNTWKEKKDIDQFNSYKIVITKNYEQS